MESTQHKIPPSKTGRAKGAARTGLRQVRVWVLDLDERTFRSEAHRQSLAAASSPHAKEDQEFIDAITVA